MILGLILLLCSIGVGYYIKILNQNKIKFKLDILNFCDFLKTQIAFNKKPLKEIVNDYAGHATPKFKKILLDFVDNVGNEKELKIECKDLTFEEEKILIDLFKNLGKSDVKNQIELCENTKNLLYANYELYKDEKQKLGDLSFKLSICVGILLLIIVV